MPDVIMYCTASCPFCNNAAKLFDKKGVSISKLRVDENPELLEEMTKRTGSDSVPQIFINEHYVGGFDELVELDIDDELDPLLGIEMS